MATYFGEVLTVNSRAVDDDEDDEDLPQSLPEPIIHWSACFQDVIRNSPDKKVACSKFLLAYGIEASAFVDIYLSQQLNFERIGGIFTSVTGDEFLNAKDSTTDKTCFIYKDPSEPSTLLCLCKREILPEESFTWSKLLVESINLSQAVIYILTTSSTGSYCSQQPASHLETPFIRCLKTNKYNGNVVCPPLEQPNMLTGFPAMLMTFFQVHQYEAVVFVCYKETRFMDITDVKSFLPIMKALPFKNIRPTKKTEKLLLELIEQHTVHDMIYM